MSRRLRSAEWFLIIGLGAVIVYGAVILSSPSFAATVNQGWTWVRDMSLRHGYLGAILASMLANASVIIPIPYTAIILIVAAAGLNPWILGITSGIGAALGEVTSYTVGYIGYRLGKEAVEKKTAAIRQLADERPGMMFLILFIVAATPIPDGPFMIPLGMIRYNPLRAMPPFILGKIVITTSIALFGTYTHISPSLGTANTKDFLLNILSLMITVLVVYIILKIPWERYGHHLLSFAQLRNKLHLR
ncbi:MAG: VTT domain-containing protein [bacterium]